MSISIPEAEPENELKFRPVLFSTEKGTFLVDKNGITVSVERHGDSVTRMIRGRMFQWNFDLEAWEPSPKPSNLTSPFGPGTL